MPDPPSQADESPRQAERTPAPLDRPTYCIGCGYDLRGRKGGAEDRCPECGISLDFVTAGPKPIPWEHRKGLGAWRAYWATVILMIRVGLPGAAYKQLDAPATYAAAQRFRWITIAIAYLGISAVVLTGPPPVEELRAFFGWLGVPIALAVLAVLLLIGSGVPSYAFERRSSHPAVRNQLIAMSYYSTAPLILMGLSPLFLFVVIAAGQHLLPESVGLLLTAGAIGVFLAAPLAYIAILLRLCLRADSHAFVSALRRLAMIALLLVISITFAIAIIPVLAVILIAFYSLP